MEVTIHIGSLIFGFMLGAGLMLTFFIACFYDDRWDDGFAKGFVAGESTSRMAKTAIANILIKTTKKRHKLLIY